MIFFVQTILPSIIILISYFVNDNLEKRYREERHAHEEAKYPPVRDRTNSEARRSLAEWEQEFRSDPKIVALGEQIEALYDELTNGERRLYKTQVGSTTIDFFGDRTRQRDMPATYKLIEDRVKQHKATLYERWRSLTIMHEEYNRLLCLPPNTPFPLTGQEPTLFAIPHDVQRGQRLLPTENDYSWIQQLVADGFIDANTARLYREHPEIYRRIVENDSSFTRHLRRQGVLGHTST